MARIAVSGQASAPGHVDVIQTWIQTPGGKGTMAMGRKVARSVSGTAAGRQESATSLEGRTLRNAI